ncbi:hypothetical protein BJ742DRAFT_531038 [Cladochytrium replicatum]|nr:hypothetical protein BJ742DRAFT_531038 [Cladochytrium replicatum]
MLGHHFHLLFAVQALPKATVRPMDFNDMLRDLEETEQSLRSQKASKQSSRKISASRIRKNSSSGSEEPSEIDSDSSPHHAAAKGKHKLDGSLSRNNPQGSDSGFREALPGRRRPKEAHSASIRNRSSDEDDDDEDEDKNRSGRKVAWRATQKVEKMGHRRTHHSEDGDDDESLGHLKAWRKEDQTKNRRSQRSDEDDEDDAYVGGVRSAFGRAVGRVERQGRNDHKHQSSGTESESERPRKRAPVKQDVRRPVAREYSDDEDPIDSTLKSVGRTRRGSSEEDGDFDDRRRKPGTGDTYRGGGEGGTHERRYFLAVLQSS